MSKNGISFFPLDVCLDTKFDLIEAEFGLQGFAVVVKLYQRIYGEQGYYCDWTNEVALLFAHKVGLGGSVVSEIVNASVKRGIFDKTLFEKYQILTSKGIQDRYFEIVNRRKSVEVDERYLLTSCCKNQKNVCKNDENVNIFPENADISKQSKVKESKVNESKVNESKVNESKGKEGKMRAYEEFLKRFNVIPDVRPPEDLDYKLLSEKVEASDFLKAKRGLSFFVKFYDRIVKDEFKDFPKFVPKGSIDNFEQRKYTKAELDEFFADYDDGGLL